MNGLIILDGPDGSGKTTLAREIVHQTGGHYMHLTYRFKEKMFTYHLANLHRAIKLSATKVVVVDRLWMSELCYANAYRGGSKWPLAYRMLERLILKHAALEVVCLPKDIHRHLDEFQGLRKHREEMFTDIGPVVIEYHKLWDKVRDWPHIRRYDLHEWSLGRVADYATDILQQLQEWRDEQHPMALDPSNYNLCGHLSPAEFLFVGNSRHQRKEAWYPFVHYGTGSLNLAVVLDQLGIEEHRCMWTSYLVDPAATEDLIPKYDLQPIVFGRDEYETWMNAHGGMGKMHKVPRQWNGGTDVLTMTLLNDARQMWSPDHRASEPSAVRTLNCEIGGFFFRKMAYGRSIT
jgi:hypothetical protein